MYRSAISALLAILFSSVAAAQQPCTTDARHVVSELYRHLLERAPEAGSAGWVEQLEEGHMTIRDVVRSMVTSPEYAERFIHPEAGEAFPYERSVGRLYRHLLGRQPDAVSERGYARMLQQDGLNTVVSRMLASREYVDRFGAWGVPGSGGLRYCSTRIVPRPAGTPAALLRGMDRNRDGAVTRDEWSGSSRAFAVYDWNGDGVIAGDEMSARSRPYEPTTGGAIFVDARDRWTDTGIYVRNGDMLLFDARGRARIGPARDDIVAAYGSPHAVGEPLSNRGAGALIGRIGNGAPFFIGSDRSVRAMRDGRLALGVNDDYLADNSGGFTVTVEVQ